jgi:hypothetical protein
LRVGLGSTINDAIHADPMFEWKDSDDSNGFMEYDESKEITAGVLDPPAKEDNAAEG